MMTSKDTKHCNIFIILNENIAYFLTIFSKYRDKTLAGIVNLSKIIVNFEIIFYLF